MASLQVSVIAEQRAAWGPLVIVISFSQNITAHLLHAFIQSASQDHVHIHF